MKSLKLSFVFLVVAHFSVALFVPESNGLVARQNKKSGNQNPGNGGNNPQTSLTLDPSVVQKIVGQGQAPGEANSLVSQNNFINFCVGKTLTNGKQVQGGSCNPTPMGNIPGVDQMPSSKFEFPPNGGTVQTNADFTISMNIQGMQTGFFSNAAATYYAAPQQLNQQGQIQGHSHVVVEKLASLDSTQPTNPRVFAFFKGLNDAAVNGKLTADVPGGLKEAGAYRMCSITSAENHQAVLVPVAQRGSVDDCSYFTVSDKGTQGGNNKGNTNPNTKGNQTPNNKGNQTPNTKGNQTPNTKGNMNNKPGSYGGWKPQARRYERRFFVRH